MPSRILELRQKLSGSFNNENSLTYVRTHVKAVDGLLSGEKLNINLLPDSLLNTKRFAGTISGTTNFGTVLSIIQAYNNNVESLYAGSYLIANGSVTVNATTGHIVQYNDDSEASATTVKLENGDHLFLVKKDGSAFTWSETPTEPTTGTIKYFDSVEALGAYVIAAAGEKAVLCGFTLIPSSLAEYNSAAGKQDITIADPSYDNFQGLAQAIKETPAWESGDGYSGTVFKVTITGAGTAYYKMVSNGVGEAKYYNSVQNTSQYIWGVVNNTYNLATTSKSGLMSAADKAKLDSLYNYQHPGYSARNLDGGDIQFVADLTVDTLGHVTGASLATIRSASESVSGVVQLSNNTEALAGSIDNKALSPKRAKEMIDKFGSLKQYGVITTSANLTAANNAHPDNAFALFETGITPSI